MSDRYLVDLRHRMKIFFVSLQSNAIYFIEKFDSFWYNLGQHNIVIILKVDPHFKIKNKLKLRWKFYLFLGY